MTARDKKGRFVARDLPPPMIDEPYSMPEPEVDFGPPWLGRALIAGAVGAVVCLAVAIWLGGVL